MVNAKASYIKCGHVGNLGKKESGKRINDQGVRLGSISG